MRILVLALACGGGPTVAATPPREVPLCAPWEPLPVGDGRVVHCDPERLTVRYAGSRSAELAPDWRLAVRSAGWSEDVDNSAEGLVDVRYREGERALGLTVIEHQDTTVVAIAVVAGAAP